MPDLATSKTIRDNELTPAAKEIERLRDLVTNENRDFTAEELEKWKKCNADFDKARRRVDVLERAESVTQYLTAPANSGQSVPGRDDYDGKRAAKQQQKAIKASLKDRGWLSTGITEEDRCLALQGWMRGTTGRELQKRHEQAFAKCGIGKESLKQKEIKLRIHDATAARRFRQEHLPELRSLAVNANTAGGYMVPEGFVQNLEMALLAYAQVRQWAEVIRTSSGQDLPWPTVNDVTNKGALVQENATVPSNVDPVFGQVVYHAYKYTSKIVLVPVELLEDSAFDLAQTLGELLGIRVGRIQADHFTFGTGASQPLGYVNAAVQGVQAASSTAIAADDLYKLKHSVDPAYRVQPGVGWTFHDQILLNIKLLKDGLGRYLWQAGLAVNAPDTIDGDTYYINQSMASTISSGNKTVAYGALRKYKIRDVSAIRMRRLVERYADSDQEAFVMFMRSDANLVDAGTHPIKVLVH